jgi:4-amino-4-deoxy-L-arabinose transferase-like glycosyltransferase
MTDKPATALAYIPYLWNRVLFPGAAEERIRVRVFSLLCVLILPALLLYPCRSFHLLEPDEGRYAQIPKEMVESGNWIVPTLQGEAYLDKPPLMYWLVSLSYKTFGISEASARLVPALAVHLTILLVYLIGRRSIGERGAFWAAMILSVAPGFLGVARLLLLDGLLTFCVTTSVLCGFEAVRTGRLKREWWIAAAVMSGLGFLTKGPISEVLLFPPLLAYAWLRARRTPAPNLSDRYFDFPVAAGRPPIHTENTSAQVRWLDVLLFGAIVICINLPWYIAIYLKEPIFLKHFFWEHNVMRFLKPFDHLEPVWYYAPIFLAGFLPGVILFVPYVRNMLLGSESTQRSSAGGFWLLSGLWCLCFFSFSGSKLPTYILPAFPPLCLALGEFVARSVWDKRLATRGIIATFACIIGFAHYVVLPWYAFERSPMRDPELVKKYLDDPTVTVVTYPRHIGSVAFYSGRSDLQRVTMKPTDTNRMISESHFRPRTVILFTQSEGLEGFRETLRTAIGSQVQITETVDLQGTKRTGWKEKLAGGPWGLCDIAVIEPPGAGQKRAAPNETAKR